MKKGFRKIGAVLLTFAMALAMNSTVLAVTTDATKNSYEGIESTDNTIGIAKSIVFVNEEDIVVREPNIVYTYTISSATPGTATITGKDTTDTYDITLPVKAGPMSAVTGATTAATSTVTFADTATSSASSTGISSTAKYANFTFTPATFGAPGIYRYKISESTDVTKASVGITEVATYSADRFLDVYVRWNSARTALEIYGYVLFEGAESDSIAYSNVTMKSEGYVNTSTSGQADVDVYTTQNLEISKVTTGALADKDNDFPVTITLTKASGLSDSIKLDYSTTNNGSLTRVGNDTVGDYVNMDAVLSGTVRDSSTIKITGIPTGSSVEMTETNNTSDYYRVKAGITDGGEDLLAEATVNNAATSSATASLTIDAKKEIHFTNTLSEISPTGFVVRFAPYALVLLGGILLIAIGLLVYNKTNKKETA